MSEEAKAAARHMGGESSRDKRVGIHAMSKKELSAAGRKGGEASRDKGVGFHAMSKKELSAAGHKGGEASRDKGVGFHGMSKKQLSAATREGMAAMSKVAKAAGIRKRAISNSKKHDHKFQCRVGAHRILGQSHDDSTGNVSMVGCLDCFLADVLSQFSCLLFSIFGPYVSLAERYCEMSPMLPPRKRVCFLLCRSLKSCARRRAWESLLLKAGSSSPPTGAP
jgi:general stress protein YciG